MRCGGWLRGLGSGCGDNYFGDWILIIRLLTGENVGNLSCNLQILVV